MQLYARCLCDGPTGHKAGRFVTDAAPRSRGTDPTGTMPLQRKFMSALDLRWKQLRKLVPNAVASKTDAVNMISHAALIGDDPVRAFQAWFDEALRQVVLGGTGSWTLSYVRQSGDMAALRAGAMVPSDPVAKTSDRIPQLQTLCITELQGIMEAASQQAVRAFANGLLTKQPISKIARSIQQVIDAVGVKRGHDLVSFIVVRTFSAATLDSFRAAGVSHVGTLAERVRSAVAPPSSGLTRDATFPSMRITRAENKLRRKYGGGGVDVQTAGDDDVCDECQDISDNGPYTLDQAEGLIPAHPKCRCGFVPADLDDVDDAIFDEFNPDQPRDGHGMWEGLGGAPMKSWSPPQHGWQRVEGQTNVDEPPMPELKTYSYMNGKGEKVEHKDRFSSGVIMREPDGRVWLIKPTNGFGGYNYTFPKGGVERDLHPQANAIKETWEETGLKAQITGYAGDYRGSTGITRMYHAVRVGGHPKDKGWETEQVALAHPDDLKKMLNAHRDRKIAKHHLLTHDTFDPDEERDEHGKWTSGGSLSSKLAAMGHGIDPGHFMVSSKQPGHIIAAKNHEGLMHESAAKHGVQLTEVGETTSTSTWKASHSQGDGSLDMSKLVKVGGKKGSNEGGVYAPKVNNEVGVGKKYYIKQPETPEHVTNELLTAKLYQLAGANTLKYVPVAGGAHVATELEPLAVSNVKNLSPGERKEAQHDFAIHAWLANWDAAGTGGDNVGVTKNGVTTLDTGGGLKYRAQGQPKGAAFGDTVPETNTLRDPNMSPDAAKLFGDMTNDQMVASIKRVTSLSNADIYNVVHKNGGSVTLAEQLVHRKNDLAMQAIKLSTAPASTITSAPKTILGHNTNPTPQPVAPPTFKTKMEHAKHLLLKGTTTEELKAALGWPSIGVPKTAHDLNLNLEKIKIAGGKFKYKGTHMSAEEIKAKGGKTTVPISTSPEPKVSVPVRSAFDPEPTPHDIRTTVGNFQQSLVEHGVMHSAQETNVGHFITLDKPNDVSKAIEIAKWHPKVEKLSAHEYFIAHDPALLVSNPVGNFKQALENAGVKYTETPNSKYHTFLVEPGHENKTTEIAKGHPLAAPADEEHALWQVLKEGPSKTVTAPIYPAPTEAELSKAKKNTKLTAQYVPGAPAGHPEAEKLISAFNAKYEGSSDHLATHEALVAKVNAFKKLQADMVPLMSQQQQKELAAAAVAKQTAVVNAAAIKAKEDALLNDPEIKKHMEVLKGIGMSKNDWTSQSFIDKHKLAITPQQGAYIRAYVGSHYAGVNEQLRNGILTMEQHKYADALNEALDKMPVYEGSVTRGANLSSSAFAKYQNAVGKIAVENQFTSAGVKGKLWGDHTFHIVSKRARDIRSFNPGEGGGEVVFKAGSKFHVTKVEGKSIWMEEV